MLFDKIRSSLRYAAICGVSLFIMTPGLQAATVAHHVTGSYYGSGASNPYKVVTLDNVFIDPTLTNWIAWHNQTTPYVKDGREWVGVYSMYGMDDYFYLTITDQDGNSSSRIRMDYNDASANSSGPQAVIFGQAVTAPDVYRRNWSGVPRIFDEAGAFNTWFDSRSGGSYSFLFEFYNGSGAYSYPEMYLLVNTNTVPVPPALLLFGSGLIGLASTRIRRKKSA